MDETWLKAGEVVILAAAVLFMARTYYSNVATNNNVLRQLLGFADSAQKKEEAAEKRAEAAEKRAEIAEQRAAETTEVLKDLKDVLKNNTSSRNQHTEAINVQTEFISKNNELVSQMSKYLKDYTTLTSDDLAVMRKDLNESGQMLVDRLDKLEENVLVRIDLMLEGCTTAAVMEELKVVLAKLDKLEEIANADRVPATGRDAGAAAVALPDAAQPGPA